MGLPHPNNSKNTKSSTMPRPSLRLLVIVIASCLFMSLATVEAKARLNFFHAVANGPAVDIQLRSKLNTTAHTIFTDLDFTEYTDYYHADGGMYDIRVVAHDNNLDPGAGQAKFRFIHAA